MKSKNFHATVAEADQSHSEAMKHLKRSPGFFFVICRSETGTGPSGAIVYTAVPGIMAEDFFLWLSRWAEIQAQNLHDEIQYLEDEDYQES